MGNDPQILENRARMWGMVVTGMTLGIWGMVEESATSLAQQVGMQILEMLETVLGKKLGADQPAEAVRQLGQIFVKDLGYAADVKVEASDKQIRASLAKAVGVPEFALMQQKGVKKMFCHPFMAAGVALLSRSGVKTRWTVEVDPTAGTETVTFDLM